MEDEQKIRIYGREITKRKKLHEALQESETRYRSLFNTMTEGFALHEIVCDDKGAPCDYRFLDVNPAFEEMTGLKRDDIVGKLQREVLPNSDPKWIRIYGEVTLTGNPIHFEDYFPDQKRYYDVLAYRPAPRQFAVIFTDITVRKQVEEALRVKTEQLENAGKELEDFSYSITHDLRAPLRAVEGYARMILKKHENDFDDDTMGKFNVVRTNAQKISMLIDDLLTFSRVNKARLSMFKVNMDDLVRETWQELQIIHPERQMNLKIGPIPNGKGDRPLIKQALYHILSNAIKFTKAREDTQVEVGGYEEQNEVIYYFRDNGVGFDMKYQNRLFSVFQRLHTDDEYGGTGVGLALVRRIIHRHGGRSWAEGEVDHGACIYFTLPKA
jgi:PAS domain S-box-containing protein